MSDDRPVGIVLAGGASKRMGVDKATLLVDGKPMVVSVADALWEASCHPVECQGGNAATIAEFGLLVVADDEPGSGPLQSIRQALSRHDASDVVVAACDLADLDAGTVTALAAAGSANECDVAVASVAGERHMAAWWRAGTADRLGELIDRGVEAYLDALTELRTIDVEVPATVVRNVNTPADAEPRRG